jgi:hypothetical protein
MRSHTAVVLSLLLLTAGACSTSQDIIVNPANIGHPIRSAYVVAHGDKSSDVDASIQRELFRHGIAVTAGPEGKQTDAADVVVKYNDEWSWDMAMYLRALDIQIYDAKSGNLLASAGWKNSALHGFHGLDSIVNDLVNGVLRKLAVNGPSV